MMMASRSKAGLHSSRVHCSASSNTLLHDSPVENTRSQVSTFGFDQEMDQQQKRIHKRGKLLLNLKVARKDYIPGELLSPGQQVRLQRCEINSTGRFLRKPKEPKVGNQPEGQHHETAHQLNTADPKNQKPLSSIPTLWCF